MEISRIKGLSKTQYTILIYIMVQGIMKAKTISRNLEIDIYNLYKDLKKLEDKGFIIKVKENKKESMYKAKEDIILK